MAMRVYLPMLHLLKGRLNPYNKQVVIRLKFSVCGIVLYFNLLLVKNTRNYKISDTYFFTLYEWETNQTTAAYSVNIQYKISK